MALAVNQRVEQVFSERLSRWSERAAIKIGERQVSYGELDALSNRLAWRLTQRGVGRNSIVAVATGNIEYFAVAILAILKAGAAYFPIDTRYPVERVRDILTDASPAILLADTDFPATLIPAGLPVIHDFAPKNAFDDSHFSIGEAGNTDDTACIYYTSGSTGRPKGIEVAHRGIPGLVSDASFVPFGPNDRIGQASNIAFDAMSFELWGALLNGGCIVDIPKDVLFSAAALAQFFELERITIIFLTTSLFNALSARDPNIFGALKILLIGGEAADPRSIDRVLRSGSPPSRLINGYGPTEATTFATWHEITRDDVDAGRVPIGKPIRNVKIHIVDKSMRAVRSGEPGELLIGGPGVANGYLHQPELTSERFIPDPFDTESSGRLYRTGDLCRKLPDGSIEYLGRIDDQVKIRGFRVEPLEVAATLRRIAGVEDTVVLARNASFGTKELIAFVRGDKLPSVEQLRQELAVLVPDYMVPSIIKPVTEFPLVANGKLDRAALLAIIQTGGLGDGIGELGDEIEKRVTAIWKHVLQRDDVAHDQDFRALGGDSLSTMDLALEIEKMFGIVFSSDDLASPLTVARLAAEVRRKLDNMSPDNPISLLSEHGNSSKVFAISYPWLMDRMPDVIGQALSAGRWQHVQVPFTYFRNANTVTIEDMAIHLERLIYSLSPEGPYVVYGQCFTGLLAYEVARRLVAAGHAVSMVVIVDSYPTIPRTSHQRARTLLRRAAHFTKRDLHSQIAKLREKLFPVRPVRFIDLIKEACRRAANEYCPRSYYGRVVFFRPRNLTALVAEQDTTAWRRLALGDFAEHIVNFHDHGRVTAESVRSGYNEIARKLNEMRTVQLAEMERQPA